MKKMRKEFEINADNIKVIKRENNDIECYNDDILLMKVLPGGKECVVYGGEFEECKMDYENLEYTLRNIYQVKHDVDLYIQAKKVASAVVYFRDNFDAIMEELKDFE